MNYLMHLLLSGNDDDIRIGNFIADHIRGRAVNLQANEIKKGIVLHRIIDNYSDLHPAVLQSVRRLFPFHQHYARVVVDIYYDHFLSVHWIEFSSVPLNILVNDFYSMLEMRFQELPARTQRILPKMIEQNWLACYGNISDLQRIFEGMNRRASFVSHMDSAVQHLLDYYSEFEQEFITFMPEINEFINHTIKPKT